MDRFYPSWAQLLVVGAAVLLGLVMMQFVRAPSNSRPAAAIVGPASGGTVTATFYGRLADLEERLVGAPDGAAERVEYARLLHDAHRHDDAAGQLERYLAARPNDRQAWLDLTNIYGAIERWEDADRVSRSLLDHFPDDAAGLYNLGAIAANRGRNAEARAWWQILVERGGEEILSSQAAASLEQLASLEAGTAMDRPSEAAPALPPGHPPIAGRGVRGPAYLQARTPSSAH